MMYYPGFYPPTLEFDLPTPELPPTRTFTQEMKALEPDAVVTAHADDGRYTVELWGLSTKVGPADMPRLRPFAAARRVQGRLRGLAGLAPLFSSGT